MSNKRRNALPQIVSLIVTISTCSTASSESVFVHPGAVADGRRGTPLPATVRAWKESTETNADKSDCPTFGNSPFQSVTAGSDGAFRLPVPRDQSLFTVTYCLNGFVPRVDTELSNLSNGTFIRPTPTELFPRGFQGEDYQVVARNKLTTALNELNYIRKVNPAQFEKLIESAESPALRENLPALQKILDAWGTKEK